MVRVLIAAPAPERSELERRLRGESGINLLPASAEIATSRPEVILAAVTGRDDPALPKLLEEAARGEAVILLAPESESGWETALRRGVRAVLPLDLAGPQLAAALAAAAAGLGVFYPGETTAHSAAAVRRSTGLGLWGPQAGATSRPAQLQRGRLISGIPRHKAGLGPAPIKVEVLTPRELEALQWLAQGLGNKQIADRMGISEHTAKYHVAAIMGKLGATSRTEAAAFGLRRGLVLL